MVASSTTQNSSARMPVLFIGHGSPMNAIEDNQWSRAFRALGEQLPRPRAVLCVSAHWYTPGTFLTDNLKPETIHDFGGFPPALHQMQYPAPGAPELARHVSQLLAAHAASGGSSASLRNISDVVAATVSSPPTHRKNMVPMISSSVSGRPSTWPWTMALPSLSSGRARTASMKLRK